MFEQMHVIPIAEGMKSLLDIFDNCMTTFHHIIDGVRMRTECVIYSFQSIVH